MIKYISKNGILKKYKGTASNVIIPKNVTAIGENVFNYNWKLKSVKIPDGVTHIGFGAFYCCQNLTKIKIPNSVRHIGHFAFFACDNLLSVVIPNNVKQIGLGTFNGCYNLTSIEIPNSITEIGAQAFNGCKNLSSINIPKNVSYIGFSAFYNIKKVKPQYNTNGKLRAFKAFNKGLTCRGFHYEIGKSYHQDGKIISCFNGFHACTNPLDVFQYYYGNLNVLRFAEVELSGEMDSEDNKVAASDIKIVRELSVSELAEIYNQMEKE